jgi:hypothetical protein
VDIPKAQSDQLFHFCDTDRSGSVSEREFCEWYAMNAHLFQHGHGCEDKEEDDFRKS